MTPTFLECRSLVMAEPDLPGLAKLSFGSTKAVDDRLRDTAEWYWNWENRTLFSGVRGQWFPPPPDLESNYAAATKAVSELHATLRSDRKLRRLSLELYPELEIDAIPQPAFFDAASQTVAEIHAVNQILIAMEQAWLGVKLEGYPEHPISRGYLNVFRRCSGSRIVHKHWPAVRSSLNQEFVQFCERELKLPGSSPKVELYEKVQAQAHLRHTVTGMSDEFARVAARGVIEPVPHAHWHGVDH